MVELENITVKFGGVIALDDVSATFRAPVSGIIGPNGAGKTTLMNVISGFLRCAGRIGCGGCDITRMAAHRRTRWGVRRSFQREQIADDLSVVENLRVILDPLPGSRAEKRADVERALEATDLTGRASTTAMGLDSYERRLVDTARCLVGRPRIVMFDEPCSGFTPEETARLGDLILKVHDLTGATTLVIDHDVGFIERICTEILVLDFGRRIALGDTRAVLSDPKVRAAYLGVDEAA